MYDPRVKGYHPQTRIIEENVKVKIGELGQRPSLWSKKKEEWIPLDVQGWEVTFPHDLDFVEVIWEGKKYQTIGTPHSRYFTLMDENGDLNEVPISEISVICRAWIEHVPGSGHGYIKGHAVKIKEINGIWTATIMRM